MLSRKTLSPFWFVIKKFDDNQGEWPSGFYSLRQATEVKLGRVRSNSGWATSEA